MVVKLKENDVVVFHTNILGVDVGDIGFVTNSKIRDEMAKCKYYDGACVVLTPQGYEYIFRPHEIEKIGEL